MCRWQSACSSCRSGCRASNEACAAVGLATPSWWSGREPAGLVFLTGGGLRPLLMSLEPPCNTCTLQK